MLAKLWTRLDSGERRFRRSWGRDISTPAARRWAQLHYLIFDHAFLRILWTNFWPVAPGVWRSNQPTSARFGRYQAMGIRTVINLRGEDTQAHYLFENEACERLSLTLTDTKLWARTAAPRKRIVAVIDALRTAEKPMVFHCKSGAGRAGFVAAMYQMVFEAISVADARKQLGLKYIHLEFTKTGVQGYILDTYAARIGLEEIGFEDWIRTEYASRTIQQGYDARQSPVKTARILMADAVALKQIEGIESPRSGDIA